MPQGHKRKHDKVIENRPRQAEATGDVGTAEGNVQVAHDPLIEGAVPGAPEADGGEAVGDAADHVLGRVDAIKEGPEAEESPGKQQLQPHDVEVEERHDRELLGTVVRPDGIGFGDGDAVVEVQDEFHAEEGEEEADAVFEGARGLDRRGPVFALRDVVVVGDDRADEVERGVDGVGEVVAEVVVFCRGGGADAIVFGEVGGVELFLLELISMRVRKGWDCFNGVPRAGYQLCDPNSSSSLC